MEIDSIEHFEVPVSHETHTLEHVFADALKFGVQRYGETITVSSISADPNDTGDLTLLDADYCSKVIDERLNETSTMYQEACLNMASLDSVFIGSEGHRPASSGTWYLHGLGAPCCEGAIQNTACGFEGLAWLLPTPGKLVRERFLIMSCETYPLTSAAAFGVTAHEMGHVLNLHHCEYTTDSPMNSSFKIDGDSLEHLSQHDDNEIQPGNAGAGWCDLTTDHRVDMHSATDPCCADPGFMTSVRLPAGVSLTLLPEKPSYFPGEPVRLRARLRIEPSVLDVERLVPGLHPYLGYLRAWTLDDDEKPRVLFPPLVATRTLSWEEGGGAVDESEIIDLWAMQPAAGAGQAFGATYSGLRLRQGTTSVPMMVASATTNVALATPIAPMPGQDRFTTEQARRFLFMMGGDHVTQGIADLQEVSRSGGPLAAYADLALGTNLATPFHHYEQGSRGIEMREPDYRKAREYLDRAEAGRGFLPFSYQIVLDQALARTYEGLGDAAGPGDAAAASDFYARAESHYAAVADLQSASVETADGRAPVPLSTVEKTAVSLGRTRLEALRQKMSR